MIGAKVLVTGSSGFIGRYLVEQLVRSEELDVTAIVRRGTARESFRGVGGSRVKLVLGDFSNPDTVRLPLREYDAVVNLVGPRSSRERTQWETNVECVRNLLVLLRHVSVKRIVHFSSVSVYGLCESATPVTESSALAPRDWYGMTKVLGERMLEGFHDETHIPVVILRPSWVVGYGSHLLDKQLFDAFSSGIRPMMRLHTPLNIVYVRDVADVAIRAALDCREGLRVYNINAVQRWCFDEFTREIDRATGGPKVPVVIPRALIEILARKFGSLKFILSHGFFSADRAKVELGFVPQYDLAAIAKEILALRASAKNGNSLGRISPGSSRAEASRR